jgi:hypothetical protein
VFSVRVALAEPEPLTEDGFQQRLSAFAAQYKAVGTIARMIHHDAKLPESHMVYTMLNRDFPIYDEFRIVRVTPTTGN